MVVNFVYMIHIISFFGSWFCLLKMPNHYFIRKIFIYNILALVYSYLVVNFDVITSAFNIVNIKDISVSPFTTIYHLYLFLIIIRNSFAGKWYGRSTVLRMFIYLLLAAVIIDTFLQTMVFSYFFTDLLVAVLSILFFTKELRDSFGKRVFRPELWIVLGYFLFSVTLIPFTITVDYAFRANLKSGNLPNIYVFLYRMANLLPATIFYAFLLLGCFKYLRDVEQVYK